MPRSPIRIVDAQTPDEFDAARVLLREYAVSLGWDPGSAGWLADELSGLPGPYARPRGSLLVAFVDGDPAGVLGLQPVPADVRIPEAGADTAGELKRLFVRPALRRLGIARALMLRAGHEARARGYDALVLTTSAEMMPLAQGLYDSLGFTPTTPYRNDMPWPNIRWLRLPMSDAIGGMDAA
jgi:GNAT superfamily N-acetyltransferase